MVHGEYQKQEIHNLGRFISVMKFRPLTWQTSHPYVLADRCVLFSLFFSLSVDSTLLFKKPQNPIILEPVSSMCEWVFSFIQMVFGEIKEYFSDLCQ